MRATGSTLPALLALLVLAPACTTELDVESDLAVVDAAPAPAIADDGVPLDEGADAHASHPEHTDDVPVMADVMDPSLGDENAQGPALTDDPLLPFSADEVDSAVGGEGGVVVAFALQGCAQVRAKLSSAGVALNIRPRASRSGTPVGQMQNGQIADALARVVGESVGGDSGWYEIRRAGVRGFAHGAYLECTAEAPPVQEACPRVVITANTSLNVRARPSTDSAVRAQVSSGRTVDVIARTSGQTVQGINRWFEVQAGSVTGFVSGAFARCTQDQAAPPPPPSSSQRYKLPLTCGSRVRIAQGNFGSFSHQNRSRYAYDFSIPSGTPMLAMKDGVVVGIYDRTRPGHRCYNGGPSDCFPHANWVALRHPDGRQSIYKHLSRVDVTVGQRVTQGQTLGLSGSTGYSTGPHAHVMRQQDCSDPLRCDSVELTFADVDGNGIPRKDQYVTSGNCR